MKETMESSSVSDGFETAFGELYLDQKPHLGLEKRLNQTMKRKERQTVRQMLYKTTIDDENLSKKARNRLVASTNDVMDVGVEYSLHKHNRWRFLCEPTQFLEQVAGDASTAVAQCVNVPGKGRSRCQFFAESNPSGEIANVCARGDRGPPGNCLRNSLRSKDGNRSSDEKQEKVAIPAVLFVLKEVRACPKSGSARGCPIRRRIKNRLDEDYWLASDDETLISDAEETTDFSTSSTKSVAFTLLDFVKPSTSASPRKIRHSAASEITNSSLGNECKQVERGMITSNATSSSTKSTKTAGWQTREGCYVEKVFFLSRDASSVFARTIGVCQSLPCAVVMWVHLHKFLLDIGGQFRDKTRRLTAFLAVELLPRHNHIRITLNASFSIETERVNAWFGCGTVPLIIKKIVESIWALIFEIFSLNQLPNVHDRLAPPTQLMNSLAPLNEYELLTALPRASDPSAHDPVHGFCLVCHRLLWTELAWTSCGHVFCRDCLRKVMLAEISTRKSPTCPECSVPITLLDLLDLVPLARVRAMLLAGVPRPQECPNCWGVGEGPSDCNRINSLRCLQCRCVFCIACRREPHFPLLCTQLDEYMNCIHEEFTDFGDFSTKGKHVVGECEECGGSVWVRSEECSYLRLQKWHRPLTVTATGHCPDCHCRYEFREVRDWWQPPVQRFFYRRPYDFFLPPQFQQACFEARRKRFHIAPSALAPVLLLVEFGTAWMALWRGPKGTQWNSVKQCIARINKNIELAEALRGNGQNLVADHKMTNVNAAVNALILLFWQ